jgi:hypothetical protein
LGAILGAAWLIAMIRIDKLLCFCFGRDKKLKHGHATWYLRNTSSENGLTARKMRRLQKVMTKSPATCTGVDLF